MGGGIGSGGGFARLRFTLDRTIIKEKTKSWIIQQHILSASFSGTVDKTGGGGCVDGITMHPPKRMQNAAWARVAQLFCTVRAGRSAQAAAGP